MFPVTGMKPYELPQRYRTPERSFSRTWQRSAQALGGKQRRFFRKKGTRPPPLGPCSSVGSLVRFQPSQRTSIWEFIHKRRTDRFQAVEDPARPPISGSVGGRCLRDCRRTLSFTYVHCLGVVYRNKTFERGPRPFHRPTSKPAPRSQASPDPSLARSSCYSR